MFLLPILAFSAPAANNWFVAPTGAGSKTGSDWNNASDIGSIPWANVAAGDTVWLAGGTYTSASGNPNLSVVNGGTSGAWLNILRATANDAACTNAAGWQAGYGTNVVLVAVGNTAGNISLNSATSYLNINGRTPNGIQLFCNTNVAMSAYGIALNGASKSNIILANMDLIGPCPAQYANNAASWSNPGLSCGISLYPASGSGNSFITISNCEIHGFFQAIYIGGYLDPTRLDSAIVIDHCRIHNIGGDPNQHSDMIYPCMSGPLVFRFNEVWDWSSMAIFLFPISANQTTLYPVYIYGNVFHDPSSGAGIYPVVLEPSGSFTAINSIGPIYCYNNTFYNLGFYSFSMNDSRVNNNSQYFNNLWIKNQAGLQSSDLFGTWNYNYSDANTFGAVEPNYIYNSGINPLVSPGVGGSFMIVSNIGAIYPRNKGMAIPNMVDSVMGTIDFSKDPNGNNRGADGAWDIGAYEYTPTGGGSTSAQILVLTQSLNFGSVPANTSVTNTLMIQNISGSALTVTASVANPFYIGSGGIYSLGVNQTQAVMVGYTPDGPPTNYGNVVISSGGVNLTNAPVVGQIVMPTWPIWVQKTN